MSAVADPPSPPAEPPSAERPPGPLRRPWAPLLARLHRRAGGRRDGRVQPRGHRGVDNVPGRAARGGGAGGAHGAAPILRRRWCPRRAEPHHDGPAVKRRDRPRSARDPRRVLPVREPGHLRRADRPPRRCQFHALRHDHPRALHRGGRGTRQVEAVGRRRTGGGPCRHDGRRCCCSTNRPRTSTLRSPPASSTTSPGWTAPSCWSPTARMRSTRDGDDRTHARPARRPVTEVDRETRQPRGLWRGSATRGRSGADSRCGGGASSRHHARSRRRNRPSGATWATPRSRHSSRGTRTSSSRICPSPRIPGPQPSGPPRRDSTRSGSEIESVGTAATPWAARLAVVTASRSFAVSADRRRQWWRGTQPRSGKTKPGVRLPDVTAGENPDDVSRARSAGPPARHDQRLMSASWRSSNDRLRGDRAGVSVPRK